MSLMNTGFAPMRFSVDSLPERDRLEAVREGLGRAIMKVDIEPIRGVPCRLAVTLCTLPDLRLAETNGTAGSVQRKPHQVESDDVVLTIGLRGHLIMRQRGREIALGSRQAALLRGGEPFQVDTPVNQRTLTFTMPLNVIAPMVADLDAVLARQIQDTELLRLLVSYSKAVFRFPACEDTSRLNVLASHMHDLVALVLGATCDAAVVAEGRGLRAARLSSIKAQIAANLDGKLSVGTVAARQRVTPRYVQMLFEDQGTTFTGFVCNHRLAIVRRMLSNPRFARLSIAEIAFRHGFNDLSTFNRYFRAKYGMTPRDARQRPAASCED